MKLQRQGSRNHEPKSSGTEGMLAIFGSALRDDFGRESDIDVLVEFEPGGIPELLGALVSSWSSIDVCRTQNESKSLLPTRCPGFESSS